MTDPPRPPLRPPLRPMTEADLTAIFALQAEAYAPEFHEDLASFRAKWRAWPEGAWVAGLDGTIAGYMFSLSWSLGSPPPLNAAGLAPPATPDCYYLHDITVARPYRGRGLAATFIAKGDELAKTLGLRALAMTAVQGSHGIWQKFGYQPWPLRPAGSEKLRGYGKDAVYLVKTLKPGE